MMNKDKWVEIMKLVDRLYTKIEQWKAEWQERYYWEDKPPREKSVIAVYGINEYGHKIWRLYFSSYYKTYKKLFKCNTRFAYSRIIDFDKIENFEDAYADNFEGWDIHHRAETDKNRSKQYLINHNKYFNRPSNELIFLKRSEHSKLHSSTEI